MEKYRGPVKESPHRLQAFTGWPTRWQLGAAAARDAGSVRRYTLAAHRGYTSSEPRSLAAARRTRGGGSPSKRQLLDAMLSLSPDAHPGTGGRLVTIETVDLHGAPTSL